MTKTIGEKILELRKARSLTQEKLGEQLGISSQAVSKWENGDSMPDIMILPQLCEILGISIDSLLEVPMSMKKDTIMKSFNDYAKETGTSKALHEVFSYCISDNENPCEGIATKLTDKWIEVFDFSGAGFVVSNEEYLNTILNFDIEKAAAFFITFAYIDVMKVIKELSINYIVTKEELLERTKLSKEQMDFALLKLMENQICMLGYDSNMKHGYLLDGNSYILIMLLTAYYIQSPRTDISGRSMLVSRST